MYPHRAMVRLGAADQVAEASSGRPLFSVVIPSYNRATHVGRCLESIVDQASKDLEVLVVDNASTDRTVEVAQEFADKLDLRIIVNDVNRERSFSRNRGAELARGRFIMFLDSDDRLSPGSIERATTFIRDDPGRRFFFQQIRIVDESGATVYVPVVRHRRGMRWTLAEGNPISCSGVFIERDLFLVHRFDETPALVGSEDWHCWIRIAVDHTPVLCPGDGALLVDHPSRTATSEAWQKAEHRFSYLTADLMAHPETRDYLAPFLRLFLGSQAHYVAVKAANQSAFLPSVARFLRAVGHQPSLLLTRRTLHLIRLWLRGATRIIRSA